MKEADGRMCIERIPSGSWCNSGGGPTALGEEAEPYATAIVQATQEHMAVADG